MRNALPLLAGALQRQHHSLCILPATRSTADILFADDFGMCCLAMGWCCNLRPLSWNLALPANLRFTRYASDDMAGHGQGSASFCHMAKDQVASENNYSVNFCDDHYQTM